ncbi:L-histidine N(alpha)-methyltransferase [Caulobacter sp. NIBR1757]|uniref:L-histidine N(alpha)-methyltransferase n=1 Tax=Caulobacter sp. NIBR1757 TaxID=3016000 RepID=UPI0022F079D1|nr:L-histidine N(alpha)-methyltransferase [Caulobacter sp. NIBR1757]WGM40404.1 Histidine N-alpha-methyltransferase [Caulobacter sp. NIBR1757]
MNQLTRLQPDLERALFAEDMIAGLSKTPKATPPKWFYDAAGSALFGEITRLPEYYPTRTEMALLAARGGDIARAVGPGRTVVEYGSGSAAKAIALLGALQAPAGYLCVEIDPGAARATAHEVELAFPDLPVRGVAGDFTHLQGEVTAGSRPRLGFFPGSTIGNFPPEEAGPLLAAMREHLGPGGQLLLGADLIKDKAILEAAYDDAAGVTARFNLNLLQRANRELGADFDLAGFEHRAIWNDASASIEMHLVARHDQTVTMDGHRFHFAAGETIHTESSYKFDESRLKSLAYAGGWAIDQLWIALEQPFALALLTADSR